MRLVLAALFAMIFGTAALAQSSYTIAPGDTLSVEVVQDASLNRSVLVLPDGSFSFPYAGTINAAGKTVAAVQDEIRQGIASNFAVEPTVFVSVAQTVPRTATGTGTATIDVYFLGEFAAPGTKALPRGTTFLQALAAGGAMTSFAAQKRLQLRRTDASGRQTVTTFNYHAIANGAAMSHDVVLRDGDVILAPERRLFE